MTATPTQIPTISDNHAPSSEGEKYRFEHLSIPLIMGDMRFKRSDPAAGDEIPRFDLPTVGGGRFSSDALGDKPVLLIFGSLSCPVTEASGPGLKELHSRFGDRVRFVAVNVREAHPGENIGQPQTAEEKIAPALALREHHNFAFEVAADDIDGTLHRSLGPKPNSAYLIDTSGVIAFRAHWATDTKALDEALGAIVAGSPLPHDSVTNTVQNIIGSIGSVHEVIDRAGPRAKRDMWVSALPMAAMAQLARLFPRLEPAKRGPAAIALVARVFILIAVLLLVV